MLPEEIMKLIDGVQNLKHRTILILLYSTGMRVSEIANCRIADIDSKSMRIKIVQGKGGKDRYTILSQQVLLELSLSIIFLCFANYNFAIIFYD